MLDVSLEFAAHLAQEVTTLATCWSVKRKDGTVFYFTDHDEDVLHAGNNYVAATAMNASAITSQEGMAVDNLEFQGMLNADVITEADILAGLYDHAEISVFMVNYRDTEQGALPLKTGWLGEVTLRGGQFIAEMRGLTSRLQQQIGQVYTSTCRARFGDARCGVNPGTYTVAGTITHTDSNYAFEDDARAEPSDYFSYGLVTFTSGANTGLEMEVRSFSSGKFTLFLPMPFPIAVGDGYNAVAGCDKTFESCIHKFNNAINFRGEPHVPGTDKLLETAATRSA